jgi:hypothetical protein
MIDGIIAIACIFCLGVTIGLWISRAAIEREITALARTIESLSCLNQDLRKALHNVHMEYNNMRHERNLYRDAWKHGRKELPTELLDCLKID